MTFLHLFSNGLLKKKSNLENFLGWFKTLLVKYFLPFFKKLAQFPTDANLEKKTSPVLLQMCDLFEKKSISYMTLWQDWNVQKAICEGTKPLQMFPNPTQYGEANEKLEGTTSCQRMRQRFLLLCRTVFSFYVSSQIEEQKNPQARCFVTRDETQCQNIFYGP